MPTDKRKQSLCPPMPLWIGAAKRLGLRECADSGWEGKCPYCRVPGVFIIRPAAAGAASIECVKCRGFKNIIAAAFPDGWGTPPIWSVKSAPP